MIIIGILEQGLIYAILALGIYITYKILDFPDLTVDSSFPLGAAVSAIMITKGFSPYITLFAAFAAGAAAGFITGFIHVKFKVRDLLSGIITMTILYSVNLHVATKANLPIFDNATIFTLSPFKAAGRYNTLITILIVTILVKILLDLYLKTKSGYLLRAVGDNPVVVTSLAKDSGIVKIVGLIVANALVALSGAVMCQQQRFFEISMGTGAMVIGLASVMIGTRIFKTRFIKPTTAVILGSIIYKSCVSLALGLGFKPIDMKLITGILFLAVLVLGNARGGKKNADA